MSFLQDSIIYVWLLPVLLQIVLPLCILPLFGVYKIFNSLFEKRAVPPLLLFKMT